MMTDEQASEAQLLGDDVVRFAARTPTLAPATHTNSYALGSKQILLVEPATPFADEQEKWIAWTKRLQAEGREFVGLLITHHHPDHTGGARELSAALELDLWAHESATQWLDGLPIARRLRDGETIRLDGPRPQRWQCLHTPGHAPDHICLREEEKEILVVGDMVASVGTILIGDDGDLSEYLEQLERLASMHARYALPAHGCPIAEPTRLFRHYIQHRLMREDKVLGALTSHGQGGAAVAALTPLSYPDLDPSLHGLATISVRAHLRKLVDDGRAEQCKAGWRLRVAPAPAQPPAQ